MIAIDRPKTRPLQALSLDLCPRFFRIRHKCGRSQTQTPTRPEAAGTHPRSLRPFHSQPMASRDHPLAHIPAGGKHLLRANRFARLGMIYHLTHPCRDRSFLFPFARNRSVHCGCLRQPTDGFDASLLNYCVTSNHSHFIAAEPGVGGISRMIRKIEQDWRCH